MPNLWINGGSRSGKTERAINQLCIWAETELATQPNPQVASQSILVLAVDAEQRSLLSDRFARKTQGQYPVTTATPLSFWRDQVVLFWPLLVRTLNLKPQFPILLRVEKEQELATELWADAMQSGLLEMEGVGRDRLVRRILDLFLLAVNSGKRIEEIPQILQQGLVTQTTASSEEKSSEIIWTHISKALAEWRDFCWQNNLLTYGIISELFHRHLLPHPQYQAKLKQNYRYLVADDVDEYPAIACDLCAVLLNSGCQSVFTFNPQGAIRLGLGADPDYWQKLEVQCESISLPNVIGTLGNHTTDTILNLVVDRGVDSLSVYDYTQALLGFTTIETISRAKLLRSVADTIAAAIATGEITSGEIAVIAPGLDNIANYALIEILRNKDIFVTPLNDQRPLSFSTQVRSLLTLLTLIYPNLGHLVGRDQVAEMLVSLSPDIDPVRAGMLADRCFAPHRAQPKLLSSETYNEWHRLGYQVSSAYEQIRQWIEQQSRALSPLLLLDRAIHKFLMPYNPSFEKLSALQELIETAQHYWQVSYRLGWEEQITIERFIQVIGQGIVTANPYTSQNQAISATTNSVTLATIYQYRMARLHHRWQFWLDVGSPLWQRGGAAVLFAAPLFLHGWDGQLWTIQSENAADQQRLERLLTDLLNRAEEKVYLCFSELNTNGQMQTGPLFPLVEIASD